MEHAEPIVLELAPLPREQLGPFLILGLDKDADVEQIDAHWAQRVIWARKNQLGISLQDINWARELLGEFDQRVRADVASLNPDTADRALRTIAARFGMTEPAGPNWTPLDVEKPLDGYAPAADIPDAEALRGSIVLPEVPWEMPAAAELLESFARQPIDPWEIRLPEE